MLRVDFARLAMDGRPAAARGGQPAVQHLDADPLSPAGGGAASDRPARDAAKRSGRSHRCGAGRPRLRPPERDAAVALRDRAAVRRARRGIRAAAARHVRRAAHDAAGRATQRWTRRCCRRSWRSRSRSDASCCATRLGAGSSSTATASRSTLQRRAEEVAVAQYVALAQQVGQAHGLKRFQRGVDACGASTPAGVTPRSSTSQCRRRCSSAACSCRSSG